MEMMKSKKMEKKNGGGILSKEDFGDLNHYSSLSSLDFLALAAQVALEKERNSSFSLFSHSPNPNPKPRPPLSDPKLIIRMPMSEKRPLPIDLNADPIKKPRTTIGIPRQSPINFAADSPPLAQPQVPPPPPAAPLPGPGLSPPPELPAEFRQRILELGGSNPELVLQKALYKTDVAEENARLTLPVRQCRLKLTEAEMAAAKRRDARGGVVGFEVTVVQPRNNLETIKLIFKNWEAVSSYVLVGSWNDLRENNALERGDKIQVWSFRCSPSAQLAFALVKLND